MAITANPRVVAVDATCLLSVQAPPNKAIYWDMLGSNGTLTAFSTSTDDQGRAAAMFIPDPSDEGSVATITATYGT